jgi:long-subunit acyl-CoA synthetase (AMP-forming)
MILHRNMVSSVAGAIKSTPIYPTDVHLSYLPLAHIFERIVMISGMSAGACLGFYQGVRTVATESSGVPFLKLNIPLCRCNRTSRSWSTISRS